MLFPLDYVIIILLSLSHYAGSALPLNSSLSSLSQTCPLSHILSTFSTPPALPLTNKLLNMHKGPWPLPIHDSFILCSYKYTTTPISQVFTTNSRQYSDKHQLLNIKPTTQISRMPCTTPKRLYTKNMKNMKKHIFMFSVYSVIIHFYTKTLR